MSRRGVALAAGAAVTGLVLAGAAWGMQHATAGPPRAAGRPAPELVLRTFDGSTLRLSELRGRPVVLNFWASWCESCRQEDPVLRDAARAHEGSVTFVGVAFRDSTAAARDYERAAPHTYPVGELVSGSAEAFGVSAPPATVFIDAAGIVVARFAGPLDEPVLGRYLQLAGAR